MIDSYSVECGGKYQRANEARLPLPYGLAELGVKFGR